MTGRLVNLNYKTAAPALVPFPPHPLEITLLIASHVDFKTVVALASTCREFRTLLEPLILKSWMKTYKLRTLSYSSPHKHDYRTSSIVLGVAREVCELYYPRPEVGMNPSPYYDRVRNMGRVINRRRMVAWLAWYLLVWNYDKDVGIGKLVKVLNLNVFTLEETKKFEGKKLELHAAILTDYLAIRQLWSLGPGDHPDSELVVLTDCEKADASDLHLNEIFVQRVDLQDRELEFLTELFKLSPMEEKFKDPSIGCKQIYTYVSYFASSGVWRDGIHLAIIEVIYNLGFTKDGTLIERFLKSLFWQIHFNPGHEQDHRYENMAERALERLVRPYYGLGCTIPLDFGDYEYEVMDDEMMVLKRPERHGTGQRPMKYLAKMYFHRRTIRQLEEGYLLARVQFQPVSTQTPGLATTVAKEYLDGMI